MPPNVQPPSNLEIEEALREFEMKSQIYEQTQEIKKEKIDSNNTPIINFIIKYSHGTITNQRQAEYVMIGVFVLCMFLSVFFVFNMRDKRPPVTDRELLMTPPSVSNQ